MAPVLTYTRLWKASAQYPKPWNAMAMPTAPERSMAVMSVKASVLIRSCLNNIVYDTEEMPDLEPTAKLLQVCEGEEVEKMDTLLSLAITGGDYGWI